MVGFVLGSECPIRALPDMPDATGQRVRDYFICSDRSVFDRVPLPLPPTSSLGHHHEILKPLFFPLSHHLSLPSHALVECTKLYSIARFRFSKTRPWSYSLSLFLLNSHVDPSSSLHFLCMDSILIPQTDLSL